MCTNIITKYNTRIEPQGLGASEKTKKNKKTI